MSATREGSRDTSQASRLARLSVIALCTSAVVVSADDSRVSVIHQPAPGTTQAAAQQDPVHPGQEDFDRICKVCHGAEARGDAGPRLVPFTRDYEELLAIVRDGSGQMPPISARELADEGVARILAYLKYLSRSSQARHEAADLALCARALAAFRVLLSPAVHSTMARPIQPK
jgi:mono/diheme cytochrome c family protein